MPSFCSQCGSPLNAGDQFCGECGKKTLEGEGPETLRNISSKPDKNDWSDKERKFLQKFVYYGLCFFSFIFLIASWKRSDGWKYVDAEVLLLWIIAVMMIIGGVYINSRK